MATPLKIGLVLDTSLDPMDGVQQYVIGIGEWLRAQGHDVHYLVGETKTRQLPNVHSLARNILVIFNGNRTTIPLPTSSRKLRRFLEEQQFDVLHVQTPHSPFMAHKLLLAAGDHTAVVATFHILPYGWMSRIGNQLLGIWLRRSLKRCDALLAVSSAAAAFASKSFKMDFTVLPNVVDYKLFHEAQPIERFNDDKLTLLFLGRLVPRKGCQLLLEAVHLIHHDNDVPAFRVLICGKGPLDKQLKEYVQTNRLEHIVEFTGFVSEEDKPRYYASADISVFPSLGGESFGIVLLEAMASGKAAVLAGDNPGYHSVMESREDLLFNPTNSRILANKLRGFMIDRAAREQAQIWGEQYTKHFDVNEVGEQLLAVYQQALRKRQQP